MIAVSNSINILKQYTIGLQTYTLYVNYVGYYPVPLTSLVVC